MDRIKTTLGPGGVASLKRKRLTVMMVPNNRGYNHQDKKHRGHKLRGSQQPSFSNSKVSSTGLLKKRDFSSVLMRTSQKTT